MPNNDIWPGRDDEMFYPLDARGSGRALPVRAKRRSRGLLSTLVWLLLLLGGCASAYVWLYLPKAQQLRLTAQLLEQATQSASLFKERVQVLEQQKQQGVIAKEAIDQRLATVEAHGAWVQQVREALMEVLAPLADQRHLQLLPHEQGLAIVLLSPDTKSSAKMGREQLALAASVSRALVGAMGHRTDKAVIMAFACHPKGASAREQRGAIRQALQLGRVLASHISELKTLRLVMATGEPDWGWSVPSDDQAAPASCLVIDLRAAS